MTGDRAGVRWISGAPLPEPPATTATAAQCVVVSARGELGGHTAQRLRDVLSVEIERDVRLIVLDTSHAQFVDTTGLREIVDAARQIEARGGRLIVNGLSGAAQRVFEVSRIIDGYRRSAHASR